MYATEMGSNAMIYKTSLMKIVSGIQELMWRGMGFTDTDSKEIA
jgi:hypothetical protein